MPKEVEAGIKHKRNGTQVKITDEIGERAEKIIDTIARRAYEIFEDNGRVGGRDLNDWLQAESELLFPLHLVVQDSQDALVVMGELPGFVPGGFEVKVGSQAVTVAGERKRQSTDGKKTVEPSIKMNLILRTIELPELVLAEKATAILKGSTLEVVLPKAAISSNLIPKPALPEKARAAAASQK